MAESGVFFDTGPTCLVSLFRAVSPQPVRRERREPAHKSEVGDPVPRERRCVNTILFSYLSLSLSVYRYIYRDI